MWQAGWRLQLQHRAATPMQGPFCTLGTWEKTVLQGAAGKGRPQADMLPAPCGHWFVPPGGEVLLWVILSDRPIHHFAFRVRAGSGFIQPWTDECSGNRWQNVRGMLSLESWPFLLGLFLPSLKQSLFISKREHTHNPDCSLQWSISSPYLLTTHWFEFTRESLLGLSNRTKERPALPSEPEQPAHTVF